MDQRLIQKLKEWRSKKANSQGVESYIVLHNKTIDTIAEVLPTNKDEFIAIKGLGGKKYEKYGREIISIVKEFSGLESERDEFLDETKVYSVSNFLDLVNSHLGDINISVKGEITSVNIRENYLFFTIKDPDDVCCMDCFMWTRDYELSGVELEEGIEILTHGYPEVYKKSGRFSFRTDAIQLVGEGILKKKYEELKKKLASEGLFDIERKKSLPIYPQRIGLITSKDGAVIHDFQTNLGRFGYKITFVDSRVEGMMAVKDLISAIRYFRDKPMDVLVIIRGGGSLESLQSFNNEALIREIADFPVPVMCGIGHDKDVPLISLVADRAESTPTAVAREINRSWEEAVSKINQNESNILNKYRLALNNKKYLIDDSMSQIKHYYQKILQIFELFNQTIDKVFGNFTHVLKYNKEKINNCVRSLEQNNPERQLKLGYSIMFSGGKVVKSINQVKKDDLLTSKLQDGEITSIVNKIRKE